MGVEPEMIRSMGRQKKYSQARSVFARVAVEEEGYSAASVGRFLGISRVGVKKALERGDHLASPSE
jgi:predicted transcriptional regulator